MLILELTPGGPAERASLLPGDILLEAGEQALHSPDDLAVALATTETLAFSFHRAGDAKVRRVTVELSARQANAA
jgi:S1-C subfamily serine protease